MRRGKGPRGPRVCTLCSAGITKLDHKDIERLEPFLDDGGRIRSRRRTHTCARCQRRVTTAVKRARHLALLPFASEHTRLYR